MRMKESSCEQPLRPQRCILACRQSFCGALCILIAAHMRPKQAAALRLGSPH